MNLPKETNNSPRQHGVAQGSLPAESTCESKSWAGKGRGNRLPKAPVEEHLRVCEELDEEQVAGAWRAGGQGHGGGWRNRQALAPPHFRGHSMEL